MVPGEARNTPAPAVAPATMAASTLPPAHTPLRLIYQDLKQRAAQGEVPAQCRLAFELQRCSQAADLRATARYVAGRVRQEGPGTPHGQSLAAWSTRLQGYVDQATTACEGFQPEADEQPWRYLLSAALAGHVPSMVSFVFGMTAGLSVQRPVSTLDGWAAYQQYAPQLLQRAVDSGSPEAYSLAAHLSVNPQYGATVVPRDRIQAAAYRMALMSRASPAYRPTLQRDVDRLNLTEMERTTASLRATELAAKLRPTAAGSIDFTQGVQPDLSGRDCEP